MKIVYRITEDDFMEARRLFVEGEVWFRRLSRRLMPWEAVACLVVGVTAFIVTKDRVIPTVLCIAGVYLFYCTFALRRFFRRLYRTDPRYKQDLAAEVSDDGIHFETPLVNSHVKWASVVRWLESEKIFMLFYGPMSFTMIPKRAFSPGEADTFREFLCKPQTSRP